MASYIGKEVIKAFSHNKSTLITLYSTWHRQGPGSLSGQLQTQTLPLLWRGWPARLAREVHVWSIGMVGENAQFHGS